MALGESTIPWLPVQPSGRIFSRSRINDSGWGPSHPLYHVMTDSAIQDIVVLTDDFITLDTTYWLGSGATANFAVVADDPAGVITVDCGADADGFLTCAANQQMWSVDHRPTILGRLQQRVVANSKFEFGFALEAFVADGNVNIKATPSSSVADYAVITRDTDDTGAGGDAGDYALIADNQNGANDGPVAHDSGIITMANTTYVTLMVNLNEQNEARYWIDGQYVGILTAGVPDGDDLLAPCVYAVDRDAAATCQLDVDYIKIWQERIATL